MMPAVATELIFADEVEWAQSKAIRKWKVIAKCKSGFESILAISTVDAISVDSDSSETAA